MRTRRTAVVTAIVIIFLLVFACLAFSQMDGRQGMGRPGMGGQDRGQDPMVTGEVVSIDENSLTVTTETGETKRLARTASTSFVRESAADRSALVIGASVFMIGQPAGQNAIIPMVIRILEKIDDMPRPRGQGGQMMQGGQMGGGPPGDQSMSGPVIGVITELDPLKIQQSSGTTTIARLTEGTRILLEKSVNPANVVKGTKIRILAPPKPGSESREARKVIVLSEAAPIRERASVSSNLLPDLTGRKDSPDFFFGIWLGRGPYSDAELDRAFRIVQNLGIRYFLIEFKWDYVEPEKGRWRWNNREVLNVERVIELAKQYRISLVPYFDLFTPWGERKYLNRDKGECEGPPSGKGQFQAPVPEEYANYVFTVVDKLKKGGADVKYVALDNEESNLNDGYRSWNCFINATAKQIKSAENAAYDRIKAAYPDIKVSSTTFSFPGIAPRTREILERDRTRKNNFVKAYFGEDPRPKFDFLALHETLSGSGNPYTTLDKTFGADYEYPFSSYHEGYDIWRKILVRYGYKNVPIINTEGDAILKNLQDAELIQKAVFARTNALRNGVSGWILSQLTASKFLREGSEPGISVGITRLDSGYQLKEGYYGYHTLLSKVDRYPFYEGVVQGELNSQKPWVEKFSDGGRNVLYISFLPYQRGTEPRQQVTLQVAPDTEVRVTNSDSSSFTTRGDKNGFATVEVGPHPVFIEAGITRR